ncbi:hypothetical protein KP509_39G054900 [Ceratopteris richardii]|nr:hypothetical protein KP509_39G054900 [Ceratopteris richardii]
MRFASLSPQERAKRKIEALEQLKRTFKKLDHDVNVEEFTRQNVTAQNIEESHLYLQNIQIECLQLQQKLRAYESFQNIEEADKLEEFLQRRIQEVRVHKELLGSRQCIVPCGPSASQQVYSDGVTNSNFPAQGAWESHHDRLQDISELQAKYYCQRYGEELPEAWFNDNT